MYARKKSRSSSSREGDRSTRRRPHSSSLRPSTKERRIIMSRLDSLKTHEWNEDRTGTLCGAKIPYSSLLLGAMTLKLTCKRCRRIKQKRSKKMTHRIIQWIAGVGKSRCGRVIDDRDKIALQHSKPRCQLCRIRE